MTTPLLAPHYGLVRWLRIGPSHVITGRALADTVTDARALLPCHSDEYVTSAVSFACSPPRALPSGRCVGCGVREAAQGYDRCGPCLAVHRARHNGQRDRSEVP